MLSAAFGRNMSDVAILAKGDSKGVEFTMLCEHLLGKRQGLTQQGFALLFGTWRLHYSYTFTHPFASLLCKIASHSFTSWCPSAAVANSAGVFFPLAMCSYTAR